MALPDEAIDRRWLPVGAHTDLNIEHSYGQGAGAFTGGGWKLCWHITVSPWMAVDSMVSVLKAKNAAPHLVIGGRPGFRFPVVVQMLPFDEAGRALAHPSGPETNRANTIQVEICARPGNLREGLFGTRVEAESTGLFDLPNVELPDDILGAAARGDGEALELVELCMHDSKLKREFNSGVAGWSDDTYKALANLGLWVENRVPIARKRARAFTNTSRFGGQAFVEAKGHLGHMHVPGNSHYDPTTSFKGKRLLTLMGSGPHQL